MLTLSELLIISPARIYWLLCLYARRSTHLRSLLAPSDRPLGLVCHHLITALNVRYGWIRNPCPIGIRYTRSAFMSVYKDAKGKSIAVDTVTVEREQGKSFTDVFICIGEITTNYVRRISFS